MIDIVFKTLLSVFPVEINAVHKVTQSTYKALHFISSLLFVLVIFVIMYIDIF